MPGRTPQTSTPRCRMRNRRDGDATLPPAALPAAPLAPPPPPAPPHDADSRATSTIVETDRHIISKVENECMPASNTFVRALLHAAIGAFLGASVVACFHQNEATSAQGSAAAGGAAGEDLATLRSDVAKLKANAPSQSHTMSDVGYHWTNLWFAAE